MSDPSDPSDREKTSHVRPDYAGGSIVNLMTSILQAFDATPPPAAQYPPLAALLPDKLDSRNVVLLVVDGLGHEHLTRSLPDGALTRHLAARITSVFPSTTATAITTFLTGEAPQQHGVTGWFTYFRELGGVLAVLPYRPRHGGSAPAVPARTLLGHVPVFDRLRARSHVVVPRHIAYSDYNTAHNGSASVRPFTSLGQMLDAVTQIVRARGAPGERNYVYAYWPELDRLAHEHGVASREAAAQLARIDTAFDEFLHGIAGTDTTVVVTADHGFVDADARQLVDLDGAHRHIARMLRLPLCGERRAAYCYLEPGAGARFVDHVEERLGGLAEPRESRGLIESGWFGLGTPHPRLPDRIGDYTLIMKDRATIKDWLLGEPRHTQIGVHGGTSPREMLVPLVVARV
ncbi:MAG: alkaline phosphatase family protein [Gammaproteobacteria bacterium]|nr:alkaline phosphatase family protein [Gammaproteobacteria bacterium]